MSEKPANKAVPGGMIRVELPADPAMLPAICSLAKSFAGSEGLPENECLRLEVAVDEVATNVIRHAYEGDSSEVFRVEMGREAVGLVIHIYDSGPGFDLESVPKPDSNNPPEELPVGGLGLFLARKMTDNIKYHRLPTGESRMTLIKHLPLENMAEACP